MLLDNPDLCISSLQLYAQTAFLMTFAHMACTNYIGSVLPSTQLHNSHCMHMSTLRFSRYSIEPVQGVFKSWI